MELIPLEHDEAVTLAEWLKWKNLTFTKTAQETFTRSWKQKSKNKQEGVNPGLPDFMVIVPAEKSSNGEAKIVFVELKRRKKSLSSISDAQKFWITAINEANPGTAAVCFGADDAIDFIGSFLKT